MKRAIIAYTIVLYQSAVGIVAILTFAGFIPLPTGGWRFVVLLMGALLILSIHVDLKMSRERQ